MKKTEDHTFVVCAYKESEYLEECLKSLFAQTVRSKILIATSTPNDHIEKLAEKYDVPVFVNNGEHGITQDWNFAVSKADTRFVTIAHQDDGYDPTYTQQVVGAMLRSKDPIIGFSDYYEIRNGIRHDDSTMIKIKTAMLLPMRIKAFSGSRFIRRRCLSLGDPVICPSVTYCMSKIPQPIFANHYLACEDWEMLEKVSKFKGDFIYIPKKLTAHRIHEQSTTTLALDGGIRAKENYEIFRKFWPAPIAHLLNHYYNKSEKYNKVENV